MKTKVETITPETARRYLKTNTQNRPVREGTVTCYAREMKMGNWMLTHQGIAFDEKGALVDGQHRLLAVLEADMDIPMMVTHGLPVSNTTATGNEVFTMDVVDRNKVRSIGDQLVLKHGAKNGNVTAACCAIIAVVAASSNSSLTMAQALAILEVYGEQIAYCINAIGNFKPAKIAPVIGTLAFCMSSHPKETSDFTAQLVSGEDIKRGMPVYALRSFLINQSYRPWSDRKYALIEVVGNCVYNTVQNEQITLIKRGINGLNFFKAKQRSKMEKIRLNLGFEGKARE